MRNNLKTGRIFLILSILVSTAFSADITVQVNLGERMQTMEGFGGFGPDKMWWGAGSSFNAGYISALIDNLGFTMIRDEVFCNIECTNDNNDPHNLDLAAMESQISNVCRGDGTSDGFNGMYGQDMTDAEFGQQVVFWNQLKAKAEASSEPLRIIGSVWSPPPWMKKCGCIKGDKAASPQITETTVTLKDGQETLDELGEFLAGWVKLFNKKTGMYPYALSIQNEARFKEPYGSCVYDAPLYAKAIKTVRKRLDKEGFSDILLYGNEDVSNANADAINPQVITWNRAFAADPEALAALDIYAVHNYFADAVTPSSPSVTSWMGIGNISKVILGGKKVWMTESGMGGTGASNGFSGAKGVYNGIKYGNLSAWTWWYTIDNVVSGSGSIYHSGYYYKQFTRFIRPGAVHVGSTCGDEQIGTLAFEHKANNCYTVLLINTSSSSKSITLSGAGLPSSFKVFQTSSSDRCASKGNYSLGGSLSLPSQSVVTLVSGKYIGTAGTETNTVYQSNGRITKPASLHVIAAEGGSVFNLKGECIAHVKDNAALKAFTQSGLINGTRVRPGCYLVRNAGGSNVVKVF